MKVLVISNIPSPYRVDFFNELGKYIDLTVLFEAKRAKGINFNWNDDICNFNAVFLNDGDISENKFDFSILKYIKKNKYDCIIATNYAYKTELLAIIKMICFRIPFCLEIDGGLINENENFLKRFFKRFIIKHAKFYLSPSSHSDEFLNYYGADLKKIYRYPFSSLRKADIIDKPVDMTTKIALRHKLGIKEEKVVISVGRFIPIKGFDILIKASAKFDRNVGVYIIGGVPTDEYIELVKSLSVSNIHFIDFLSKEELDEYYMASDLFVLPSRGDVWGLVINEAMSKGLPIITTYSCVAGKELVKNGENGFLVSPNSPNELFDKMSTALTSGAEFMNKKSLEVIRSYTIENMVKLHLDFFKTIYR